MKKSLIDLTLIGHDVPYYMAESKHPDLDYGNPPTGTDWGWRLNTNHRNPAMTYITQEWNIYDFATQFRVTCNINGDIVSFAQVNSLLSACKAAKGFEKRWRGTAKSQPLLRAGM